MPAVNDYIAFLSRKTDQIYEQLHIILAVLTNPLFFARPPPSHDFYTGT
jgi:hypothetical protein